MINLITNLHIWITVCLYVLSVVLGMAPSSQPSWKPMSPWQNRKSQEQSSKYDPNYYKLYSNLGNPVTKNGVIAANDVTDRDTHDLHISNCNCSLSSKNNEEKDKIELSIKCDCKKKTLTKPVDEIVNNIVETKVKTIYLVGYDKEIYYIMEQIKEFKDRQSERNLIIHFYILVNGEAEYIDDALSDTEILKAVLETHDHYFCIKAKDVDKFVAKSKNHLLMLQSKCNISYVDYCLDNCIVETEKKYLQDNKNTYTEKLLIPQKILKRPHVMDYANLIEAFPYHPKAIPKANNFNSPYNIDDYIYKQYPAKEKLNKFHNDNTVYQSPNIWKEIGKRKNHLDYFDMFAGRKPVICDCKSVDLGKDYTGYWNNKKTAPFISGSRFPQYTLSKEVLPTLPVLQKPCKHNESPEDQDKNMEHSDTSPSPKNVYSAGKPIFEVTYTKPFYSNKYTPLNFPKDLKQPSDKYLKLKDQILGLNSIYEPTIPSYIVRDQYVPIVKPIYTESPKPKLFQPLKNNQQELPNKSIIGPGYGPNIWPTFQHLQQYTPNTIPPKPANILDDKIQATKSNVFEGPTSITYTPKNLNLKHFIPHVSVMKPLIQTESAITMLPIPAHEQIESPIKTQMLKQSMPTYSKLKIPEFSSFLRTPLNPITTSPDQTLNTLYNVPVNIQSPHTKTISPQKPQLALPYTQMQIPNDVFVRQTKTDIKKYQPLGVMKTKPIPPLHTPQIELVSQKPTEVITPHYDIIQPLKPQKYPTALEFNAPYAQLTPNIQPKMPATRKPSDTVMKPPTKLQKVIDNQISILPSNRIENLNFLPIMSEDLDLSPFKSLLTEPLMNTYTKPFNLPYKQTSIAKPRPIDVNMPIDLTPTIKYNQIHPLQLALSQPLKIYPKSQPQIHPITQFDDIIEKPLPVMLSKEKSQITPVDVFEKPYNIIPPKPTYSLIKPIQPTPFISPSSPSYNIHTKPISSPTTDKTDKSPNISPDLPTTPIIPTQPTFPLMDTTSKPIIFSPNLPSKQTQPSQVTFRPNTEIINQPFLQTLRPSILEKPIHFLPTLPLTKIQPTQLTFTPNSEIYSQPLYDATSKESTLRPSVDIFKKPIDLIQTVPSYTKTQPATITFSPIEETFAKPFDHFPYLPFDLMTPKQPLRPSLSTEKPVKWIQPIPPKSTLPTSIIFSPTVDKIELPFDMLPHLPPSNLMTPTQPSLTMEQPVDWIKPIPAKPIQPTPMIFSPTVDKIEKPFYMLSNLPLSDLMTPEQQYNRPILHIEQPDKWIENLPSKPIKPTPITFITNTNVNEKPIYEEITLKEPTFRPTMNIDNKPLHLLPTLPLKPVQPTPTFIPSIDAIKQPFYEQIKLIPTISHTMNRPEKPINRIQALPNKKHQPTPISLPSVDVTNQPFYAQAIHKKTSHDLKIEIMKTLDSFLQPQPSYKQLQPIQKAFSPIMNKTEKPYLASPDLVTPTQYIRPSTGVMEKQYLLPTPPPYKQPTFTPMNEQYDVLPYPPSFVQTTPIPPTVPVAVIEKPIKLIPTQPLYTEIQQPQTTLKPIHSPVTDIVEKPVNVPNLPSYNQIQPMASDQIPVDVTDEVFVKPIPVKQIETIGPTVGQTKDLPTYKIEQTQPQPILTPPMDLKDKLPDVKPNEPFITKITETPSYSGPIIDISERPMTKPQRLQIKPKPINFIEQPKANEPIFSNKPTYQIKSLPNIPSPSKHIYPPAYNQLGPIQNEPNKSKSKPVLDAAKSLLFEFAHLSKLPYYKPTKQQKLFLTPNITQFYPPVIDTPISVKKPNHKIQLPKYNYQYKYQKPFYNLVTKAPTINPLPSTPTIVNKVTPNRIPEGLEFVPFPSPSPIPTPADKQTEYILTQPPHEHPFKYDQYIKEPNYISGRKKPVISPTVNWKDLIKPLKPAKEIVEPMYISNLLPQEIIKSKEPLAHDFIKKPKLYPIPRPTISKYKLKPFISPTFKPIHVDYTLTLKKPPQQYISGPPVESFTPVKMTKPIIISPKDDEAPTFYTQNIPNVLKLEPGIIKPEIHPIKTIYQLQPVSNKSPVPLKKPIKRIPSATLTIPIKDQSSESTNYLQPASIRDIVPEETSPISDKPIDVPFEIIPYKKPTAVYPVPASSKYFYNPEIVPLKPPYKQLKELSKPIVLPPNPDDFQYSHIPFLTKPTQLSHKPELSRPKVFHKPSNIPYRLEKPEMPINTTPTKYETLHPEITYPSVTPIEKPIKRPSDPLATLSNSLLLDQSPKNQTPAAPTAHKTPRTESSMNRPFITPTPNIKTPTYNSLPKPTFITPKLYTPLKITDIPAISNNIFNVNQPIIQPPQVTPIRPQNIITEQFIDQPSKYSKYKDFILNIKPKLYPSHQPQIVSKPKSNNQIPSTVLYQPIFDKSLDHKPLNQQLKPDLTVPIEHKEIFGTPFATQNFPPLVANKPIIYQTLPKIKPLLQQPVYHQSITVPPRRPEVHPVQLATNKKPDFAMLTPTKIPSLETLSPDFLLPQTPSKPTGSYRPIIVPEVFTKSLPGPIQIQKPSKKIPFQPKSETLAYYPIKSIKYTGPVQYEVLTPYEKQKIPYPLNPIYALYDDLNNFAGRIPIKQITNPYLHKPLSTIKLPSNSMKLTPSQPEQIETIFPTQFTRPTVPYLQIHPSPFISTTPAPVYKIPSESPTMQKPQEDKSPTEQPLDKKLYPPTPTQPEPSIKLYEKPIYPTTFSSTNYKPTYYPFEIIKKPKLNKSLVPTLSLYKVPKSYPHQKFSEIWNSTTHYNQNQLPQITLPSPKSLTKPCRHPSYAFPVNLPQPVKYDLAYATPKIISDPAKQTSTIPLIRKPFYKILPSQTDKFKPPSGISPITMKPEIKSILPLYPSPILPPKPLQDVPFKISQPLESDKFSSPSKTISPPMKPVFKLYTLPIYSSLLSPSVDQPSPQIPCKKISPHPLYKTPETYQQKPLKTDKIYPKIVTPTTPNKYNVFISPSLSNIEPIKKPLQIIKKPSYLYSLHFPIKEVTKPIKTLSTLPYQQAIKEHPTTFAPRKPHPCFTPSQFLTHEQVRPCMVTKPKPAIVTPYELKAKLPQPKPISISLKTPVTPQIFPSQYLITKPVNSTPLKTTYPGKSPSFTSPNTNLKLPSAMFRPIEKSPIHMPTENITFEIVNRPELYKNIIHKKLPPKTNLYQSIPEKVSPVINKLPTRPYKQPFTVSTPHYNFRDKTNAKPEIYLDLHLNIPPVYKQPELIPRLLINQPPLLKPQNYKATASSFTLDKFAPLKYYTAKSYLAPNLFISDLSKPEKPISIDLKSYTLLKPNAKLLIPKITQYHASPDAPKERPSITSIRYETLSHPSFYSIPSIPALPHSVQLKPIPTAPESLNFGPTYYQSLLPPQTWPKYTPTRPESLKQISYKPELQYPIKNFQINNPPFTYNSKHVLQKDYVKSWIQISSTFKNQFKSPTVPTFFNPFLSTVCDFSPKSPTEYILQNIPIVKPLTHDPKQLYPDIKPEPLKPSYITAYRRPIPNQTTFLQPPKNITPLELIIKNPLLHSKLETFGHIPYLAKQITNVGPNALNSKILTYNPVFPRVPLHLRPICSKFKLNHIGNILTKSIQFVNQDMLYGILPKLSKLNRPMIKISNLLAPQEIPLTIYKYLTRYKNPTAFKIKMPKYSYYPMEISQSKPITWPCILNICQPISTRDIYKPATNYKFLNRHRLTYFSCVSNVCGRLQSQTHDRNTYNQYFKQTRPCMPKVCQFPQLIYNVLRPYPCMSNVCNPLKPKSYLARPYSNFIRSGTTLESAFDIITPTNNQIFKPNQLQPVEDFHKHIYTNILNQILKSAPSLAKKLTSIIASLISPYKSYSYNLNDILNETTLTLGDVEFQEYLPLNTRNMFFLKTKYPGIELKLWVSKIKVIKPRIEICEHRALNFIPVYDKRKINPDEVHEIAKNIIETLYGNPIVVKGFYPYSKTYAVIDHIDANFMKNGPCFILWPSVCNYHSC